MSKSRTELDAMMERVRDIGPDHPNWLPVAKDCLRMMPSVVKRIAELERENAELRESLETARQDSERLDKLEREVKAEPLLLHNCAPGKLPRTIPRGLGLLPHNPRTLRQAIDACTGGRQ
jgi:hypothetical protein